MGGIADLPEDGDHEHHDHHDDQDQDHDLTEVRRRFRELTDTATPRAPLYARLSAAIADHPPTAALLLHAPPTQRQPVLLFACVHWLLLTRPDLVGGDALRRHYPNLVARVATDDPWPAFRDVCVANGARLAELLRRRSTQTNEIGRCAVFVPVLAPVAAEFGPLAHLDVGASGGLTLLLDRYRYRYADPSTGAVHEIGPGASPITLECGLRGTVPIPDDVPRIADRLGLDLDPVDLTDAGAADWLRACVWPDQADRFERLTAAIHLARSSPPTIVRGDAVDDLARVLGRLDPAAHPVVTTSWALNYLDVHRQGAFVTELDRLGASRDLTWCAVESPQQTPGLPWPDQVDRPELTHVLRTTWRAGHRAVEHLASAHPHGYWLHAR